MPVPESRDSSNDGVRPRPASDQSSSDRSGDRPDTRKSAATGTTAASTRALIQQFITFYFRAPIKAFFRTRFDYAAYIRAVLNSQLPGDLESTNGRYGTSSPFYPSSSAASASQSSNTWGNRLKATTPALLARAVHMHGWAFIPNQVLPPLLANVFVGAMLYTSYLQSLSFFHSRELSQKNISTESVPPSQLPPPSGAAVFRAGLTAGCIQTLGAAPLDALQLRFRLSEMQAAQGQPNMWRYAWEKLRSIGPAGIFAGFGLSILKDGIGYGLFFAAFEVTKTQAYITFVTKLAYWRGLSPFVTASERQRRRKQEPHYLIEPTFLLLAGASATILQQVVVHPLSRIQQVHILQLETLDRDAAAQRAANLRNGSSSFWSGDAPPTRISQSRILSSLWRIAVSSAELAARPFDGRLHAVRLYYNAYASTFRDCRHLVCELDLESKLRREKVKQDLLRLPHLKNPPSEPLLALAPPTPPPSRHQYYSGRAVDFTSKTLHRIAPNVTSSLVHRTHHLKSTVKNSIQRSVDRSRQVLPSIPSPSRLPTIPLPRVITMAISNSWTSTRAWHAWLYRNFWASTVRQVPSTSAGLIIFEIFRRKNADSWTTDSVDE